MNPTFDYLKLVLPCTAVSIARPEEFSRSISNDGTETHMRYKQITPYSYTVDVDLIRHKTTIAFSGKALLENYPSLISSKNITECFDNINKNGICHIDTSSTTIKQAVVTECDVTTDIPYTGTIVQLLETIVLKSSYTISKKCENRFYLKTTYVTRRKEECMVVYDKSKEMLVSSNKPFFKYVSNSAEQHDYFKDKLRIELNLRSIDRIRKYFQCTDTSLHSILNTSADPIGSFLEQALCPDDILDMLIDYAPKLRDLEHILLLCICGFDLNNVESIVRRVTLKNSSITNNMKPYRKIYRQIVDNGKDPIIDVDIITVQTIIQNILKKTFSAKSTCRQNSLLKLYFNEREKPDLRINNPLFIFNIPYVTLPALPD